MRRLRALGVAAAQAQGVRRARESERVARERVRGGIGVLQVGVGRLRARLMQPERAARCGRLRAARARVVRAPGQPAQRARARHIEATTPVGHLARRRSRRRAGGAERSPHSPRLRRAPMRATVRNDGSFVRPRSGPPRVGRARRERCEWRASRVAHGAYARLGGTPLP